MIDKIMDKIGYLLFLSLIIIISPYLFISGGVSRIIRYYKYVSNTMHNKDLDQYFF